MAEVSRPDVEAEIRAKQEQWMTAWQAADRTTLEQLLAPEFALVVSAQPTARVDRAAHRVLRVQLSGLSV
jgi:hypothetical protein